MPGNFVWRAVLIVILTVALVAPARADLDTDAKLVLAGIVVVSAVVTLAIVALVINQKSKHRAITGCIVSGANGMSVTDEKDQRIYVLRGGSAAVKPGERVTLQGARRKEKGKTVLEAYRVIRDLGACQP